MGEYARFLYVFAHKRNKALREYCRAAEGVGPYTPFDLPHSGTAIIHYSFFIIHYSWRFVKRNYDASPVS